MVAYLTSTIDCNDWKLTFTPKLLSAEWDQLRETGFFDDTFDLTLKDGFGGYNLLTTIRRLREFFKGLGLEDKFVIVGVEYYDSGRNEMRDSDESK